MGPKYSYYKIYRMNIDKDPLIHARVYMPIHKYIQMRVVGKT